MATTSKIVDGKIEITEIPEVFTIVETLTRKDVVGKRAEAQTVVDHLVLDAQKLQLEIATAQAEVDKLDDYLKNEALK